MALRQIGWMVSTDFGSLMSHEVEFNRQRSALSIQPWISGLTDLLRNLAPRFSNLDWILRRLRKGLVING